MPVADDIAEGFFKLLFHFLIEILFFFTGECILYVLTSGRKKIRWDYYADEKPLKFVVRTEISWWIGFFFWLFLLGWLARNLFA